MPWLPADWTHPQRVDVGTGHHLRPIRGDDVDIDYPAVMGSRERLWSIYGAAWGWPPATMTLEQDRDDLVHHQQEIAAHDSFNYALLNEIDKALDCIEKAFDKGFGHKEWMEHDPDFASIKNHPRFKALMRGFAARAAG